jgi:choline monooxygenase
MSSWQLDPDPGRAWTLPSRFYTDPSVFDEGKERIFAPSWQFITEMESCKVPGQVYPFTLLEGHLDEPLLFSRDRDDKLHCLSNVCTHRGNLVCEGAGVANHLRCRYHGRRFGLDGKLHSMPEFEGVEGFPAATDNLPHVPFAQWRKWLFASCSPRISLDQTLAEVDRRVGWLPMESFVHDPSRVRDYLVKGHWALYVDNYLEGFHIPYIHAALNATLDYGQYRTELFETGNLQVGAASGAEECFDLPQGHPDQGQRIAAYYFWIYPNLMLNFYPWGLSVNVVRPLGPDRTRVTFLPYVWDESKRSQGAGAELDRVEREDEAVVEMVQRGLRSRFYDRGRYSPAREAGVHQFHRFIVDDLSRSG